MKSKGVEVYLKLNKGFTMNGPIRFTNKLFLVAAIIIFFAPTLSFGEKIVVGTTVYGKTTMTVNYDTWTWNPPQPNPRKITGIPDVMVPADMPLVDPFFGVNISVRKGDFVKVTFAGSMRGHALSHIELVSGPAALLTNGKKEARSSGDLGVDKYIIDETILEYSGTTPPAGFSEYPNIGWPQFLQRYAREWRPFYLVGFWQATDDGVLRFRQVYYNRDNAHPEHCGWTGGEEAYVEFMPDRVAFAEIVRNVTWSP